MMLSIIIINFFFSSFFVPTYFFFSDPVHQDQNDSAYMNMP